MPDNALRAHELGLDGQRDASRRFGLAELLLAADGALLGPNAPRLPAPPLLGFDEIPCLSLTGGGHGRGFATARKGTAGMEWVFASHFRGDPVLPGTLMLDGLLQLTGLFGGVLGFSGLGRATGMEKVRFLREVTPAPEAISYRIDVRRIFRRSQVVVAEGTVSASGMVCLTVSTLSVVIVTRGGGQFL
ncbi:bifunctional 3-hydroxydecanoyl-ACP dehydratase/trans-2-decenoyl-ACP isomerase [Azospirillum sp. sgz301742]